MNHATIVVLTLALTVACDTQQTVQDAPSATKASARAAATPAVGEPPAGASGFASLSDCLGSCDQDDASKTDRATCRLNCETAYSGDHRVGATARTDDVLARAAECLGRCQGTSDAHTCESACKTTAGGDPAPPATGVLDQLAGCVQACHLEKDVKPTDRATCELNCTQAARVAAEPPPAGAPAGA
jgi:hypothetical protein